MKATISRFSLLGKTGIATARITCVREDKDNLLSLDE